MKKFLILASLAAIFLFSFTLMSEEEKKSEGKKDNEKVELTQSTDDIESEKALKDIDKLDFSKIKTSNESPDFDAHAGLD